ncbi:alpha/beta hydrolase family protein [Streptomyces sp. AC627_RSS907]|uniref:alpha/beta hydrolase family protein n=1 Tax=Streptomyces sp. AC627_RSS907 TaxID=2823684 RepID=UPI001C213328|nr:alpha/beta hydrolase family protein [Streptomyces sp. AC627_RSS907]
MTSFDTSPQLNAWRALLALAVVFVMLATTGWTALRNQRGPTALEASVAAWEHGRIDGRRLPDAQAAPARLARFFASLTERQRTSLARRYPLAVGNMNGAPVELRYVANRAALRTARTVERQRMHDKRLSLSGQREAGRRMHRYESLLDPDRRILAFDPAGSGRVAEVFGNLDRAERVSVVVPGVDTELLTFQRTERAYTAPVGMAKSLYAAERAVSPGTRTAVIAWADYTSPSGLGMEAATATRAERGAVRLNALVRALPGRAPVSLFCHSYGSVVCGLAADTLPGRVTDIAVAGSPGMRAENASRLDTSARVWAMRDADDWIQDVPNLEVGGLGHGADPVSAAFGARVLSARGAEGHAGYFVPGTESLRNFAEIGVGAYHTVACADENDTCRVGLPGTATVGRA